MSGYNNDQLAKLLADMANAPATEDPNAERTADDCQHHPQTNPPETGHPAAASGRVVPVTHCVPSHAPQAGRVPFIQPGGASLYFQRTLIPILLTMGVICPALVGLGFLAGPLSSYNVFAEHWIAIPFLVIGVVMLGLGLLMMCLVRNERMRRSL